MTSASYVPPPAPSRPRRRGGVVWPILLIFLGAVFLLQNTGYLPPNFWLNLWRLWPVILVLVGIELLFANRIPWILLAGVAAAVLLIGVVITNKNVTTPISPQPEPPYSASTELGSATQAAVTVRFGAGQLNVSAIDPPVANQLATMYYQGPPPLAPTPRYTVSGGVGQLEYQASGHGGPNVPWFDGRGDSARCDMALSPSVPITSFTVQSGAADAHVDMTKLQISSIELSIGAANAWVRFPEAGGHTSAHIGGGASNITLDVPEGVAAQIQYHGGLSTVSVDQNRFPQIGDNVYRSSDWDTATNKLDLSIDTGVTSIQVN